MRIALATVGTTGDVAPFVAEGVRGREAVVAGPHADAGRIAAVAADVAGRPPLQQVAILRDFHIADGEDHSIGG